MEKWEYFDEIEQYPDWEDRYHEYFYIHLNSLIRKVFKNIPFSVGYVLYLSLVVGVDLSSHRNFH